LTDAYGKGDLIQARAYQRLINQLLSLLPAGQRIGAIKRILSERHMNVGTPVPPRPMAEGPLWAQMKDRLASFNLL